VVLVVLLVLCCVVCIVRRTMKAKAKRPTGAATPEIKVENHDDASGPPAKDTIKRMSTTSRIQRGLAEALAVGGKKALAKRASASGARKYSAVELESVAACDAKPAPPSEPAPPLDPQPPKRPAPPKQPEPPKQPGPPTVFHHTDWAKAGAPKPPGRPRGAAKPPGRLAEQQPLQQPSPVQRPDDLPENQA